MNGLEKLAERYASSVEQITPESEQQKITPSKGEVWKYVIQKHLANRRGKHFDLRLGDPHSNVAHSWAVNDLPGPGESSWAIRQPGHKIPYMGFSGKIQSGYGAGTVSIHDSGPVKVVSADENKIKFLVPGGSTYDEYSLVNIGGDRWKMFNKTMPLSSVKELGTKPKYRSVKQESGLNPENDDEVWQPKLDGASALIYVRKGQSPRVFSYRMPKRSGRPIEHTLKIMSEPQAIKGIKAKEVVLRGEVIGMKDGVVIPAHELGGILNSNIIEADKKMRDRGISLRVVPFSVESINGVSPKDSDEVGEIIRDIVNQVREFDPMPVAETKDEKVDLLNKIKSGDHPLTSEGVVVWKKSNLEPAKFKLTNDTDVYIREIYPSSGGKYGGVAAGGFSYSLSPRGQIVGKCGGGMNDSERIDMLKNPKNWIGRVAVVTSSRQMPSGALFQPRFIRLHLDK